MKRWRTAGIPLRHDGSRWRDLFDQFDVTNGRTLLNAAKGLKRGEAAKWLVIHGHPTTARSLATSLILRAACDAGLTVRQADPSGLIDAQFAKPRDDSFLLAGALVVRVGREPSINKWTKYVLERVVTERWDRDLFTVLVSSVKPVTLAGRYRSVVVEESLRSKFQRVRLAPVESE